jgi:multidrug resistance efflux pump
MSAQPEAPETVAEPNGVAPAAPGRPPDGPAGPPGPPGPPGAPAAPGTVGRPAEAPAAGQPAGGRAPDRAARVRRIVLPILLVFLLGGIGFGINYYWESIHYVSTDNAQITGQPVQVGALSAGRVVALDATVGTPVHRGDILAQVALPSQVGTAQSGTPKLEFLGPADSRVDVQAPIDGMVIAVPSAVGATVAAGTPLVTLVDPTQVWVNANVDETKVGRVKAGQPVDVHVDALGGSVPGRVESVTPATAATFSLLPSQNTTGNFTKVTQVVPVRIAVNLGNQPALLGGSVHVRIRVA